MADIVLTGDTSGAITIAAPDVSGTNTLTLPASTGTLLTTTGDGSGLTGIPAPASLSTASGSAPSYSARAWVNFNGTGTVAIRESGNVSSITDNGTGDYTVNFTTAMPDANYSVVFGGIGGAPSGAQIMIGVKATGGVSTSSDLKTTTQLRINLSTAAPTYSVIDNTEISASIFR